MGGGKPPRGRDFNGILYDLSSGMQYSQVGMHYPFNQAFCDGIGGYPKGAIILGSDGVTLWQSTIDSNTTDPDSEGASGWLTPLQAQIIDIVDAPLIGNLQFRASVAEGDGWLRLPEKATSANATLSRTDYGKLFAKIGTTYGGGDGSTTFGLPTILDSTGQFSCFLRPMLATGTIGAKHGDAIRNITGQLPALRFGVLADGNASGAFDLSEGSEYGGVQTVATMSKRHVLKLNASKDVPTALENTPNYAEYPIFIFVGRNPY